jgi:glycerophosphoryl diester phosphodiesterase
MCVFQIPTDEYGINLMRADMIKNAHKHNLAVHYWTIDDKETMRELIGIGADGIMTNYPHRLAEVYAEYGE